MLTKKLSYLLVTLLVGIVMGCASSNPLVDKAQSNIESQNYEEALTSAEQSIKEYPGDPLGYYYKAVALGSIAETLENPQERSEYYSRMNETFGQAQQVADTAKGGVPDKIQNIPAYKQALWQAEYNRGVKLATDDSVKATVENPLQMSLDHMQNATLIIPDSANSWNALAQIAAMSEAYDEAANAKSKFLTMVPDTSITPNDYMQLASYYYNLEDHENVVKTLEKAQTQFPEDQTIVSNLADAYNRIGEPQKAIATVEELVKQDPTNPRYHLVLGTQIYHQALTLKDSIDANNDRIFSLQRKVKETSGSEANELTQQISSLNQENQQYESRIEDLTARAEEELKLVLKNDPDNADTYNTLGIIYQNKAKALFDQRNRTTDNAKAAELDKQGKEYLREAMAYYEKAAEIDPENKEYWRSLFSIYTALGMDKKAQEAMEKAGMN